MARKATVRSLVVVSDLHCGCQMGLCPPDGAPLDGGGRYLPNKIQAAVWGWWREFWDEFVPEVTRGEPFDVLINGDAIDNEHHGVKTLISNNIETQRQIAFAALAPVRESCDRMFYVRGTGAHDGESGQEVETLARKLDCSPDTTGRYSRWELWYRLDGPMDECLVHALHHIGGTGGSHYDTSAPKRELIEEFIEAARSRLMPPFFTIRSHRHRYCPVEEPTDWGRARCVITPGWQGKTGLAHKIAGARVTLPQFGGVVLRNGEEEAYHRAFLKRLARPEVE